MSSAQLQPSSWLRQQYNWMCFLKRVPFSLALPKKKRNQLHSTTHQRETQRLGTTECTKKKTGEPTATHAREEKERKRCRQEIQEGDSGEAHIRGERE